MKKEEFTALPLQIALDLIWQVASPRLRDLPAPDVPRPPAFDGRMYRKGGFVWMSEMLLEDLEWWLKKKRESAQSDGQYAEKDAKTAETLARWVAWRQLYPSERWRGKRGEDRVTGDVPSKEPRLNESKPKGEGDKKAAPAGTRGRAPAPPEPEEDEGFGGF